MKKHFIYLLSCPKSSKPRYIGVTSNIEQRYIVHQTKSSNLNRFDWIDNLKLENLKPLIIVLEEFISDRKTALSKEANWIDVYVKNGNLLLNKSKNKNHIRELAKNGINLVERNEIRLVDISEETFEAIKKKAKEEKRTIGKQALVHIENDLKNNSLQTEFDKLKPMISNTIPPIK